MDLIQIITTNDGSHSLLNTELHETYHSTHGALQESKHVFISMGLEFLVNRGDQKKATILEIGFGTGLNALLTLAWAEQNNCIVEYTTLETFPLPQSIWSKLNYDHVVGHKREFQLLHECEWNRLNEISVHFSINKLNQRVQQAALSNDFDLIYFDAFAPNKQPEMWALLVFEKMHACLRPGGVLVTYCAKGQVKRDLRASGFYVETLAGPPGKREMIRAERIK
jgi:tRNA U34 5-methylaminomethyl-2-thiouridine-forming methyltransferase MnmC